MIIYRVINKINNNVYIGQTIQSLAKRKWAHLNRMKNGSSLYFHNAIRQYGVDNFQWDVAYQSSNIDNLNYMEIYLIIFYDTFKNGYNMTTGGNNALHSDCTVNKMSNNMQGNKNHFYNKIHTTSSKKKIGHKSRLNWKNQKVRDKVKKNVKEYWENPIVHVKASNRTAKSWENPTIRDNRIKAMKKGWRKRRARLAKELREREK